MQQCQSALMELANLLTSPERRGTGKGGGGAEEEEGQIKGDVNVLGVCK